MTLRQAQGEAFKMLKGHGELVELSLLRSDRRKLHIDLIDPWIKPCLDIGLLDDSDDNDHFY